MRPREPFTFFVDRSLGADDVPSALRVALRDGERVVAHDALGLQQDTDDDVWLAKVGDEGWIALTKDHLRKNPLADLAIIEHGVAKFGLGSGGLKGTTMGQVLSGALDRIRTAVRRYDVPLRGIVTTSGDVIVYLAAGAAVQPPKRYAAKKSPFTKAPKKG